MIDVSRIVKRYSLQNAVDFKGKASPKSVLGKVLADYPDLRRDVLSVKSLVEETIRKINKMSLAEQKRELRKLGRVKHVKKPERRGLPDLPKRGRNFVVRFAPNPNGALHLGSARPAILCWLYAKKYNGKFILRFDDTDPKTEGKKPEKKFYKWIKEDLKWLGIKPNKEIIASKRLKIYYKYAELLVEKGYAYVCTCGKEWKNLRNKEKACPCRDLEPKAQMKRWKKMLAANTKSKTAYKEGEAVLRIKTDLSARNPAVRDWPAMRIVNNPKHPLRPKKYKLWPLYNFASAIDDHDCSITHILRGQEHSTNETKQRFIYDYLGWSYPTTIILGRFSLSDVILSKSKTKAGISKRIYNGWDDPRLGTLRSLRRRGFTPKAIINLIQDIGPKPSDITVSLNNLAAYNKKIIDKIANRYFFVTEPKKIIIKNHPLKKIEIPLHPERKKGWRKFSLSNTFYISRRDFEKYKGQEIRLKDLFNVRLGDVSTFTSLKVKSVPKIQWVPKKHITIRVIEPEKMIKGYAETNLKKAKRNEIVQFERYGFVRIEKTGKRMVAVFSHT
jgi:glutamyl-tRNA synthetase